MVYDVTKHLPEGVDVFPTAGRLYEPSLIESGIRQCADEGPPLRVDCLPAARRRGERAQVGPLGNGRIGLPHPAMQPELFGPDDVAEGAVNPAVAALQVAEVLLLGQLGDRIEDRAVRPGVVVEQLEEFLNWGLGPGA